MAPVQLQVEFYFDVVSPYSFLAFEVFRRYTAPNAPWNNSSVQVSVKYLPFFLGGNYEHISAEIIEIRL
jgi:hypothetical protein